jgi:hypothetical protein
LGLPHFDGSARGGLELGVFRGHAVEGFVGLVEVRFDAGEAAITFSRAPFDRGFDAPCASNFP